jgi:RNA polymerase sigma factor (sigma-70 family)
MGADVRSVERPISSRGDAVVVPADAEIQIVAAIDAADPRRALDLMMAAYGESVYGYCSRTLKDDALADDVHQLVFVQAYQGLASFGKRSSVKTWLFGIACHRCLDALKSARRASRRFVHEDADISSSEEPSFETKADGAVISRVLDECLAKLAPQIRMVLLLRFNQDFTFEEMSGMLGEKAGTLQARVARAMPILRGCLLAKGITP